MSFALRGEKNRFVLPAMFRKNVVISSGGERVLAVVKHHKWKCLSGFGLSRADTFDTLVEKETARHAGDLAFDPDEFAHNLNGYIEVPFDPSGRYVLPSHLSKAAGLGEEMFLHGAGDNFTIWNPAELYAMGPAFDGAKEACREMQAEALAGKGK